MAAIQLNDITEIKNINTILNISDYYDIYDITSFPGDAKIHSRFIPRIPRVRFVIQRYRSCYERNMSAQTSAIITTLLLLSLLPLSARAQEKLEVVKTTVVITAKPLEPTIDTRNAEVFQQTLFSRDDQIFHQLNAGINAGQHEGGGKSIEVRRFGFNLDHGGVNGGLKVLVDDVQQNQGTQGHGQGYLGSLKSLSPELVQEANIINGPFSAEYGDFSGLGVVHIRDRKSVV